MTEEEETDAGEYGEESLTSFISEEGESKLFEDEISYGVSSTISIPKPVKDLGPEGVVTEQHLKEISRELGLIKLCWEEVPKINYESQLHYPITYMQNSNKEKVLLWYAENFRQQFMNAHPDRRPLLIACDNECGVQKMVSTTIRPTNVKFPEFKTWQGCATFVAEYLRYEPLESPTLLPDHINSPQTVLRRQIGHCFEYSTLLVSILLGSGFDAYVVFGYATREICQKDQTRVDCPFLQDEPEEEEEEEELEDEKYFLKKPIELKSKFLQEMEERELQEIREARRAQELAELEAIREFEKPPPDDLWSWRVHSWVLVLPSKEITEPFFIESTTGVSKSIEDPDYHGIESLWNHQNYFVWVQFPKKTETCGDISFNLKDPACWERLLIGEPITFREMPQELLEADLEELQRAYVDAEKHLDMPFSWVDMLELPHTAYERRFPNARRVVRYRKSVSEQFSPYSQSDGLVERVTRYYDYDCRQPREIRERYSKRSDFMYFCQKNVEDESILEKFYKGRPDGLKERFYYEMNTGVEDSYTLQFYHDARLDGLSKLVMDPVFMTMDFVDRADFQYYFHVDFAERTSHDQPYRVINKITEKFHRNPEKDADKDVATVDFFFTEKYILLKFHYEHEHVTQTSRSFLKPLMEDKGVRITFDPSQTSGYLTGPTVPPPKPLYLYRLQLEYFKLEEMAEKKTTDRTEELLSLLRLRSQELAAPRFMISEFDIERNAGAKEAFKEQEEEQAEAIKNSMKMTWDYLTPYYAKLGLKPKTVLSQKLALEFIEECLKDWKNLLVSRANEIQRQFEQSCQEFQDRNNWYEQNQSTITREQEEEYFDYCKRNTYNLRILEVQLNRHKERAPQLFREIQACLRSDPRLAQAFAKKRRHKKLRREGQWQNLTTGWTDDWFPPVMFNHVSF